MHIKFNVKSSINPPEAGYNVSGPWKRSAMEDKCPLCKVTKKYQEKCKKCLTNELPGGNICKLSDERPLRGREGAETAKNLEKREKSS